MNRLLTQLGALALAVLPLSAQPGNDDTAVWIDDFDKAVEIAQREKKDLFVDFTGSDWCGWCIKLDKEVFAYDAFLTPVTQNFVLVKLDFPRSAEAKAKVPNPDRNRELQAKYGVRGFPTILMMTADGAVYGQTGYREGGPEKYVEHIDEVRTESRAALGRVQEQIAAFKSAKGDARMDAARKLLAELKEQGADSPFAELIADALGGLLKEDVDADMKRGVMRALIGAGQVDAALVESARTLDPKNEDGLYQAAVFGLIESVSGEEQIPATTKVIEGLLATGAIKDERELDLRITAADWTHRFLKQPEAAKAHARRALELAPKDNERLRTYLQSILDAE